MVCLKSGATEIKLLGDTAQIPFINRMSGVVLGHDKMEKMVTIDEFLDVS